MLQAMGDPAAAAQQYTAVLQLQPGNAKALLRRGLCHHALRDYTAAACDFEAAKRLEPHNPWLRLDIKSLRKWYSSYVEVVYMHASAVSAHAAACCKLASTARGLCTVRHCHMQICEMWRRTSWGSRVRRRWCCLLTQRRVASTDTSRMILTDGVH